MLRERREIKSHCTMCRRKVGKNPSCDRQGCPKQRGKFRNKIWNPKNSIYNKPIWKGNPNKPMGERGGIREQQLLSEPFCRHCKAKGIITTATVADHIKDWKLGASPEEELRLFTDRNNLQSLCASCHNKKTGENN